MKRKIYFTLLLLIFGISLASAKSSFTNNYGVFISSDEYQRLINVGFTDYEIDQMDLEEYEKYKDLNGKILSQKTIYLKTTDTYSNSNISTYNYGSSTLPIKSETIELSESEYYHQINQISTENNVVYNPQFAVSKVDDYRHMTVYILETNRGYQVKYTVVWDVIPTFRSKDYISVEVDNSVRIKEETREGRQNWTLCNGSDCYSGYQNYDCNSTSWTRESTEREIILNPNLKNDEKKGLKSYKVKKLDLYVMGDLKKADSSLNIKILTAIGRYKHQILTGLENFDVRAEINVNW